MQIEQQCEDHLGHQIIYYTLEQGVQKRLLCQECIQQRNILNYHNIEGLPEWIQSYNEQGHQLITFIDTSFKQIQYQQQLILELVKQRFKIDISKLPQYTYFQLSNLINVLYKINECFGQFEATVNFVAWRNELSLFKSNFLDPNFSSYNQLTYQQNLNTQFQQEKQELQKTNADLINKIAQKDQENKQLMEQIQNHKSQADLLLEHYKTILAINQQNQFVMLLYQDQLMEKDEQIQKLSKETPKLNPIKYNRKIVQQKK